VVDLGVDVPCDRFVEAVKKEKPAILAMSGLLTIVVDEMGKVIDALRDEGMRDKVRIMIGGRAVNSEYAREIGADAFGASAVDAVRLAVEWTGEKADGQ
jgi:methanogenic corrinoid protein MtbC1